MCVGVSVVNNLLFCQFSVSFYSHDVDSIVVNDWALLTICQTCNQQCIKADNTISIMLMVSFPQNWHILFNWGGGLISFIKNIPRLLLWFIYACLRNPRISSGSHVECPKLLLVQSTSYSHKAPPLSSFSSRAPTSHNISPKALLRRCVEKGVS